MDFGVSRWEGVGWVKGRFFHTFELKSSYCVFTEVHKQPQFTCQADTVAGSSLTPIVTLLIHPSGTANSIVDCHEFNRITKMMPVKADLVIVAPSHWCAWIMQECGLAFMSILDFSSCGTVSHFCKSSYIFADSLDKICQTKLISMLFCQTFVVYGIGTINTQSSSKDIATCFYCMH